MNTYSPPEPHVAQQSRRDKLRVQHAALPPPIYDAPPMFSSGAGILDFTSTPTANDDAAFINASTSGIHDPAAWMTNNPMQSPLFPSHLYQMKQGISAYHHDHLPPDHNHDKQYGFPSAHQIYHPSSLHDVVTTSANHAAVMVDDPNPPCSWGGVDGGNELLLLPSYGNPTSTSVWMTRGQQNQWYGDGDMERMKVEGGFGAGGGGGSSQTQSLSLSLSSNPLPELQVAQFEERLRQEDLAGLPSSIQYPKVSFASVHGTVSSTAPDPRRGVGPLGPFTGYAAILKSSKFLKPAQQLLDEFCSLATGSKLARQCDGSGRSSGAASFPRDSAISISSGGGGDGRGGNSVGSSSSFYGSTEGGGGGGGGEAGSSSGSCQMHRPEFQQKRAKLLYMQEEVCRRYKQYHQQMQMVVSSFDTVAGLSAATPYTSLALKSVAKHFRCLKNAISDQLRHVSKLLGEEFMSSSPGSSKGDATTPRLKYADPSIRKQKAAEHSLSFFDHNQPVWRPQRGLPERAVSVLRAWLFGHFLHPYPTDTDKHMLATQTGLSRNQVSNWFINARVRLWKPMVEEIHMLETKGMSGMDLNSSNRNDGKAVQDDIGQPSSDQMSEAHSNRPMDCLPMEPMLDEESTRAMEQWHREKRSRLEECGIPGGMDGSLMSFAAYQGGVDIGGLGAVSLTLGLRHNEGAQQQQQHLRRHFESHMVHDFVG